MADFHFLRPLWLFCLLALPLVIHLLRKLSIAQSGWQQFLPQHLTPYVLGEQPHLKTNRWLTVSIPCLLYCLSVLALAGPTWQKLPQPVYQAKQGNVLVMDMTYSMYATDLAPNRLTRARFKAIDILNSLKSEEFGLVAYAGDAFTISPLTEDINNIKLLLPSLSPDIMPETGDNPLAGLKLAASLLNNAGFQSGTIFWLTDDISSSDRQDVIEWLRSSPYRVNILGIGTIQGAPIKLPSGELLKDDNGAIVIPKLPSNQLALIAKQGKGIFVSLTDDNSDVTLLTKRQLPPDAEQAKKTSQQGDQWVEAGPYFVVLMLPLLLIYFRRGLIFIVLLSINFIHPTSVHASWWDDLWRTKSQQAQQLFEQQQYNQAAELFNDPLRKGSAYYRAKEYEKAAAEFAKYPDNATAQYNLGNALAQMQQIGQAIKAYDKALALDPNLTDAKANKQLLEQLKKQQEQQSSQDQQDKSQQNEQQNLQNQQNQQNQNSSSSEQNQQQSDDQSSEATNPQNNQDDQASEQQNEQQKSQQHDTDSQKNSNNDEKQPLDKQQAQALSSEQLKQQEQQQKYQQMLNQVTDDPYLLLRNKMQLEYQKRRQQGYQPGEKKKW